MTKTLPKTLAILFSGTICAFAQDTILLKNGDTLTGKILEQNAEHVYFKSSAFGSVSLNTREIAEIRIPAQQLGEISVPGEALQTANADESTTPQLVQKEPAPPQTQKKKAWAGQAGLAIAMRESNTLRRSGNNIVEQDESYESYRIYGNVDWKGEQNKLRWDWTYRYSRTDLRKNDDYFNVTQKYNHTFKQNNYYATAKTLYQRDFRRGIENEYLQTAELGIKWFDQPKFHLSTSVGGGYHQYDRAVTVQNEEQEYTTATPKFIMDQSLRWQMVNSLTLFQKYTHLGDLENYHFIFSSGLENKLVRDLFLRLEYRLDRDTDVAYDDKGYYDKALLTSVLYKF